MTNSKRGQISPYQLFFIVFVSRMVVSLTYVQSVSVGEFSTDTIFSFAVSYVMSVVLSLPVIMCLKKNKSPFLRVAYSFYFILFAAITVSRFSYFATTKMNPNMPMLIFIIVGFVAAGYGAYLGIEGIGRFGFFCGGILLVVIVAVGLFNLRNFQILNLFPLWSNSTKNILLNSVLFTSNSIEPALLYILKDRTNGDVKKPYYYGLTAAYLMVIVLLLFCCGVLGNGANYQSFPIFTLFQMASALNAARLDVLHTAFWVFAMFLKTSVLVYCACCTIKKLQHKTKALALAALGGITSVVINYFVGTNIVQLAKIGSVSLYALFLLVIPILTLIFRKENVDETC